MNNVIIDTDNYEASGIHTFFFPGGEPHCQIPDFNLNFDVHIFAKIRTWNDMGKLMIVLNALSINGINPRIFMPYFPGARQDRSDGHTPLTAEMYALMLERYNAQITVADIHSAAALDQVSNWTVFTKQLSFDFIPDLITDEYDIVICPDKGAVERTRVMADELGIKEVIHCTKQRDFTTGKLLGFDVPEIEPGKRYLIMDDCCDGGGTFAGIYNGIKTQNPAHKDTVISLYVTHGIFSRELTPLLGFDRIYTTNSWCDQHYFKDAIDNKFLKVIDLLPYYLKENLLSENYSVSVQG